MRISSAFAAAGVLFVLGCAQYQRPILSPNGDVGITARFRIELNKHTEINAHNLDVDCVDGTFTLSGIVDTPEDKRALVRMARGIRGVHEVMDNLIVRPHSSE